MKKTFYKPGIYKINMYICLGLSKKFYQCSTQYISNSFSYSLFSSKKKKKINFCFYRKCQNVMGIVFLIAVVTARRVRAGVGIAFMKESQPDLWIQISTGAVDAVCVCMILAGYIDSKQISNTHTYLGSDLLTGEKARIKKVRSGKLKKINHRQPNKFLIKQRMNENVFLYSYFCQKLMCLPVVIFFSLEGFGCSTSL